MNDKNKTKQKLITNLQQLMFPLKTVSINENKFTFLLQIN